MSTEYEYKHMVHPYNLYSKMINCDYCREATGVISDT